MIKCDTHSSIGSVSAWRGPCFTAAACQASEAWPIPKRLNRLGTIHTCSTLCYQCSPRSDSSAFCGLAEPVHPVKKQQQQHQRQERLPPRTLPNSVVSNSHHPSAVAAATERLSRSLCRRVT